jgi:hypothetical protein
MLIHNPIFTGSISLNGTDISQISTVSTDSSSFASRITNNESTSSAFVVASGSFSNRIANTESTASAFISASGSFSTRTTAVEATASQLVTASGSLAARLTSNEARTGSFATTGSNYFIGNQVITGSVYIANDLIVQGSSSLQNITASAVSVGTNTIILNTATPILQFGGISVFDSGSTQGRSGSLLWNSINDHWINVNPSGSDEGYNSAMVINGPKNTGSLGNEAGLTTNYIPVSQGEDHITDSIIFQSGSVNIGIGTTTPAFKLDVNGNGRFKVSTDRNLAVRLDTHITLSAQSDTAAPENLRIYADTFRIYTSTTAVGLTERFSISNTGAATFASNVTAGNGTAAVSLAINRGAAGDGNGLRFQTAGTNNWYVGSGATGTNTNLEIYNHNTATTNLHINYSNGNIGIGTTSPGTRLEILSRAADADRTLPHNILTLTAEQGNAPYGGFGGAILFKNRSYTSGMVESSRIRSVIYDDGAPNNFGGGLWLETTPTPGGTLTPSLVLNYQGRVGIGTTAPTEILHLNRASGTGTFIRFQDTGGGGVYIGGRSEAMELYAGGTERMRITGGAGNDLVIGLQGGNPYTAASRGSIFLNGSSNSLYGWGTGGTARGYMYHNGTNVFLENSVSGNSFNIIQVGAGSINFSTNSANRMTISSNGVVIVGRTLGNNYSQTSTSSTTSIIDTGITYDTGDYGGYGTGTTYQVVYHGNANNAGSGAYFSQYMGILMVYTGWSGSAVTTYIQYTQLASGANVGTLTLTPHFWNGSSQVSSIGVYTTGYQIRLRIDGYNSSFVGANQGVYLTRLSS